MQLSVAIAAMAWGLEPPRVQADTQAKASAIILLADYVTWPKSRGMEPLVIGIVGECAMAEELSVTCRARVVQGRKLRVVRFENPYGMDRCDILFVCEGEAPKLEWAPKGFKEKPILTLGEEPGLAKGGVMVNLVIEKKRLVIEVNLAAIRRSGLMLSSRVLQVARIIES